MKIALLANLKDSAPTWPGMAPNQWDQLLSWGTIQMVTMALAKAGHHAIFIEGDQLFYNNLQAIKPDICFNLCQGHFGEARRAQIPGMLEMLQVPYTSAHAFTMALDQTMTKRILVFHNLPTPPFQVLERVNEAQKLHLHFPLWVVPSKSNNQLPVEVETVITGPDQLEQHLSQLFAQYQQPALVEQYFEGQEVTIGIVGNVPAPRARRIPDDQTDESMFQGLTLFPILEIAGPGRDESESPERFCYPASLAPTLAERLRWLAAAAFRVIGCLDYAVIKFRLDAQADHKPYISAVDPLPSIEPDTSLLWSAAAAAGWSYEALINQILEAARQRYGLNDEVDFFDYQTGSMTGQPSLSFPLR